jgi:hypothetical protein
MLKVRAGQTSGARSRTPFSGSGMVVRRDADEFVPAIGISDEAGSAEVGNHLVACTERVE